MKLPTVAPSNGVIFAFNDDCGSYLNAAKASHVKAHPYYIRATLLMDGAEYLHLQNAVNYQKRKLGLSNDHEIKWSYIWSLRKHEIKNEPVPSNKPYASLAAVGSEKLVGFFKKALGIVHSLQCKQVIITLTKQVVGQSTSLDAMLRMHLECHLQRIRFETPSGSLAVVFFDPESPEKDRSFREAYRMLRASNYFNLSFNRIKDSLNFEVSSHSVGIQLADFIAGACSAKLKHAGNPSFQHGAQLFDEFVAPCIRTNANGKKAGFGICEVPTNASFRLSLASVFAPIVPPSNPP
jgi:hypothetical protein